MLEPSYRTRLLLRSQGRGHCSKVFLIPRQRWRRSSDLLSGQLRIVDRGAGSDEVVLEILCFRVRFWREADIRHLLKRHHSATRATPSKHHKY